MTLNNDHKMILSCNVKISADRTSENVKKKKSLYLAKMLLSGWLCIYNKSRICKKVDFGASVLTRHTLTLCDDLWPDQQSQREAQKSSFSQTGPFIWPEIRKIFFCSE